jgi:large conductance mechanosensitive channel
MTPSAGTYKDTDGPVARAPLPACPAVPRGPPRLDDPSDIFDAREMIMLQEFKKFALRGNVLDLAIGVIIGAAFGKIVSSLVDDVMMPPIGVVLSVSHAQDFQDWSLPLKAANAADWEKATSYAWAKEHGVPTINYGRFVNNVFSFLIVAFSVFLVVRQVNRFSPPVQKTRECPLCCSAISTKAKRCPNCTSEVQTLVT